MVGVYDRESVRMPRGSGIRTGFGRRALILVLLRHACSRSAMQRAEGVGACGGSTSTSSETVFASSEPNRQRLGGSEAGHKLFEASTAMVKEGELSYKSERFYVPPLLCSYALLSKMNCVQLVRLSTLLQGELFPQYEARIRRNARPVAEPRSRGSRIYS